jgi:SAM hydroxide adenosyltransferase C-terminal domain
LGLLIKIRRAFEQYANVRVVRLMSGIESPLRRRQAAKLAGSEGFEGAIIHIDCFGNCITNLTDEEFRPASNSRFEVEGAKVLSFGDHFAEFAQVSEPFGYPGSAGYWEIAIWRGSAAERLGIRRGSRVRAFTGGALALTACGYSSLRSLCVFASLRAEYPDIEILLAQRRKDAKRTQRRVDCIPL